MPRRSAILYAALWIGQLLCLAALALYGAILGTVPRFILLLGAAVFSAVPAYLALRALIRTRRHAGAARRHGEQLGSILSTTQQLWGQQTPDELLAAVAEAARTLIGAIAVTAYLPDPDEPSRLGRLMVVPADAKTSGPSHLPIAFAAWGLREGKDGDILAPLAADGTPPAGLLLLHGVSSEPRDAEYRALSALTAHAVGALDNARRHARVLAQASEDSLTGLLNHRAFQTRLEAEIARACRHGHALSMMMIDLDNFGTINNHYGHQAGDATLLAVAMALRYSGRSHDIAARYGGDEFAVVLPETGIDEAVGVAERALTALRALSAAELGVPITLDASIGVAALALHAQTREELVRAADHAAYAAKHAGKGRIARPEDALLTLNGDAEDVARQLANANVATVEALAAAVDAKDPYTRGHAQRVSIYAAAIAGALGLSATQVERVRLAGLLHDVGKIGISDAILTKAGPLTAEEGVALQQHPVIGERMLSVVPFLREILPAVRHHHERWDGQGYPDGLAGAKIPPDAAILMVADAFDAMTTSRPYRSALPLGEALRRMREGQGTQFDPRAVVAFDQACADGALTVLSPGATKILSGSALAGQAPPIGTRKSPVSGIPLQRAG